MGLNHENIMLEFEEHDIRELTDTLDEYLKHVRGFMSDEAKSIEKKFHDMVAKYPEQEHEMIELFQDDHRLFGQIFVKISNESIFLMAQSVLENRLKSIARILEVEIDNYEDLEELYKILKKHTGLKFEELSPLWIRLRCYRKIRNIITHHGGNIKEGSKKPLNKLPNYSLIKSETKKDKTLIEVEKHGDMHISERYVTIAIADIREFLLWLVKIIKYESKNN